MTEQEILDWFKIDQEAKERFNVKTGVREDGWFFCTHETVFGTITTSANKKLKYYDSGNSMIVEMPEEVKRFWRISKWLGLEKVVPINYSEVLDNETRNSVSLIDVSQNNQPKNNK